MNVHLIPTLKFLATCCLWLLVYKLYTDCTTPGCFEDFIMVHGQTHSNIWVHGQYHCVMPKKQNKNKIMVKTWFIHTSWDSISEKLGKNMLYNSNYSFLSCSNTINTTYALSTSLSNNGRTLPVCQLVLNEWPQLWFILIRAVGSRLIRRSLSDLFIPALRAWAVIVASI